MNPLFAQTLSLEAAGIILTEVANRERNLKRRIAKFLEDDTTKVYFSGKQIIHLKAYVQAPEEPFLQDESVNQEAIGYLIGMMKTFISISTEKSFKVKKNLLQTQLTFLNQAQLKSEYL